MNRNFWILTIGQAVSILGSEFGQMAQALLIYNLTGSKLAMGTLFLLSMGTETALRLLGSPLVDRVNRLKLMAALDIVATVLYAVPPLLAGLGVLQVWHLYVFAVAAGLSRALYAPAYLALVPSVVDRESLVRANSFSQSLTSAAGLLGPAVAGVVITLVGAAPALAVDAVSYGLSAISLLLIPTALGRVSERPAAGTSYVGQLAEGVRFYRSVPMLILLLLGAATMNFSMSAGGAMLVPLVREQLGLDVTVVGFMSSAFSGGMLLGGVVMGWIGQVKRRTLSLMAPLGGAGLVMMAMALLGPGQLVLAVAAWGAVGMGVGMFNPQSGALYHRLVPDELRGRVMSVRITVAWGALPLGASLGAMVADWAGLPLMLASFGLVTVLVAAYALSSRSLRQMDVEQQPSETVVRPAA